MNSILLVGNLTMSSREIAELCDKQHPHVLRDIRNMATELYQNPKLDGLENKGIFVNVRKDNGQTESVSLSKDLTLTLISGYSITLRHRIMVRWQALEDAAAKSVLKLPDFTDPVAAARAWADAKEGEQKALADKQAAVAALEEARPAIEHASAVEETTNTFTMLEISRIVYQAGFKEFGGQNRLIDLLCRAGLLIRKANGFSAHQRMIERGYFREVESLRGNTKRRRVLSVQVTGKGEVWIIGSMAKIIALAEDKDAKRKKTMKRETFNCLTNSRLQPRQQRSASVTRAGLRLR